ncbi:MAG TPA: phasin family protein [Geminicoccaceae bacterium]|nr:phasin family protein [Geminicoccaceae bacterium]
MAAKAKVGNEPESTFGDMFAMSKRNLDAWTQAGQIYADGAQALMKRQNEIFTGYVNEYVATVQEMLHGEPMDEKQYNKRLTQAKAAYETGLANAQELYGIAVKANNEALDVLSKAFMAQLDQATSVVRANGKAAAAA